MLCTKEQPVCLHSNSLGKTKQLGYRWSARDTVAASAPNDNDTSALCKPTVRAEAALFNAVTEAGDLLL